MARAQGSDLMGQSLVLQSLPPAVGHRCGAGQRRKREVKILLIIRIHCRVSFQRLVPPLVGRVFWDLCLLRFLSIMPCLKQPTHFQSLILLQWPLSYLAMCEY